MGWDRLQRHQIGRKVLRVKDVEGRHRPLTDENYRVPTPTMNERLAGHCDGVLVARSQILVSGSTATLLGTLTNETGCYVYFSGMPPFVITFETDGSESILLGDFNSVPRAQPSSGDCVMHPGARVPYRSLPITLHNPSPRWDGTYWCISSHSTTLDKTFYNQREVRTLQILH